MRRFILPFIFFIHCLVACVSSGAQVPDTVRARLAKMPEDSLKVIQLNSLLREYINQDPVLAGRFGEEALKLSQKIDYRRGMALSTMYIGIVAKTQSEYAVASKRFKEALAIYEELNDNEGIAKCSNNLGNVFREQGQHEEALKYYLKALSIFENLNNKEQIGVMFNNIALVHYELGNNAKSLEFHAKSLKIKQELNDLPGISASYNNMGTVFRNQNEPDRALEMFQNSLKLDEQLNDRYGIAVSLNNIGLIHYSKNNFEEALNHYFKALEVSRSIDFKDGTSLAMIGIGDVYNDQDKYANALSFFERSLAISKEANLRSRMKDCYAGIARAYYGLGNYQKAYDYFKDFSLLKDSMLNEESTSIIARIQESYNTEKKDRHIELLEKNRQIQEADLKRKNTTIYSLYAGIALVLLLVFFIYKSFREKQKANVALSAAYQQIEEKNKDITDSINYARKIQTAILPDKNLFEQAFPESFILYKPKDIVSGDFYYFTSIEDGYIIAAADCTGHGVPGAFMSMIGNDLLNHIILEKRIYEPSRILCELNEGVANALKQGHEDDESELGLRDGMDIGICFISRSMDRLIFSGAHRPMFIVSREMAYEVKPDKISIGGRHHPGSVKFTENIISLKEGDVVYLYSDGYVDQFGGMEGKKFMSRRFKDLLTDINTTELVGRPMPEQQKRLENELVSWMGSENQQVDDILVIGIRI